MRGSQQSGAVRSGFPGNRMWGQRVDQETAEALQSVTQWTKHQKKEQVPWRIWYEINCWGVQISSHCPSSQSRHFIGISENMTVIQKRVNSMTKMADGVSSVAT